MPNALSSLDPGTALVCTSCGRAFTLADALQPSTEQTRAVAAPAVVGTRRNSRRSSGLAALGALVAVIAVAAWMARPGLAAERQALSAYCAPLASSDSGYPRAMLIIRNRAWMASCLSQPEGTAAFIRLPDPRIGAATVMAGARLRDALAPLRGHVWNQRLGIWVEGARKDEVERGDGLSRAALAARGIAHVTAEDFGVRLRTALGEGAGTQAILDLLSGVAGADAQAIGRRMLIEGQFPDQLILRPFSGSGGVRLIDQGRPPYATVTSDYTGVLLRCIGVGWPADYRILALHAGKG
jgi:hypothetical protein